METNADTNINANPNPNLSKQNLYLEEVNLDMNSVLSFTFNIDNLKLLLTTMIKNQSSLSKRLSKIEKKLNMPTYDKVKYISKTPNKDKENSGEITQNEDKSKEEENEIKEEDNNNQENIGENDENKENGENEEKEKDENEDNNGEGDDLFKEKKKSSKKQKESKPAVSSFEIFEINNNIKNLQQKIKNLELFNKVNKMTSSSEDQGDSLQILKKSIKDLKEDNKQLKKDVEEHKRLIEDMSVKINDTNIYDIFNGCKTEEGSIDAAKALVMSLEQKFFKKTSLMDERNKKLQSDFMDIKIQLKDIFNKDEVLEQSIKDVKNNFQQIGDLVSNSNNENLNTINNIETKVNNMYHELFNKYDEKSNKIETDIQKIVDRILNLEKCGGDHNVNNAGSENALELGEEAGNILASLKNRIDNMGQKFNKLKDKLEVTPTKEDIEKLEKELSLKINSKDFYELKDKYNIQLAKTNNLEETTERLQDIVDKSNSEIIFYTKKVESLTSNVILLKSQFGSLVSKDDNKGIDFSIFLEKSMFNKYIKSVQAEKFIIENNFEEIKKLINDLSNTLQKKCNAEDLKIYENIINNKIEELKLSNSKRFADKNDTNKSMKFLDTQIKHIIDVYIKRIDKNDSWLIATKPLGGYKCASCESYLGELKNKESYLFWNKYPQRESDKNYRVGNGFSRMLNMLNVDLKNNEFSNDKDYESDEDIQKVTEESKIKMRLKNTPHSRRENHKVVNKNNISAILKCNTSNLTNRSNLLPKLQTNKNEADSIVEVNANDIKIEYEDKETLEQPQIVKIVKKGKTINTEFLK